MILEIKKDCLKIYKVLKSIERFMMQQEVKGDLIEAILKIGFFKIASAYAPVSMDPCANAAILGYFFKMCLHFGKSLP